MSARRDYIPRIIDALLEGLLAEFPAILVVGPRATGKTTSARRLAREAVHLDRPEQAAAVRAAPDDILGGFARPLLTYDLDHRIHAWPISSIWTAFVPRLPGSETLRAE